MDFFFRRSPSDEKQELDKSHVHQTDDEATDTEEDSGIAEESYLGSRSGPNSAGTSSKTLKRVRFKCDEDSSLEVQPKDSNSLNDFIGYW